MIDTVSSPILNLVVAVNEERLRLDAFLALRQPDFSRSRFKALVKSGHVCVNGAPASAPDYRLASGDSVSVSLPEPEDPTPKAENITLDVVYEDAHLIVIDKPAGLVVHPAAGNWTGTLVNALIHHCGDTLSGIGGVRRPGIVHRLDKDTTGLMVVAKTDTAHRGLSEQFADHGRQGGLVRAYRALVWGAPNPRTGVIKTQIGRSRTHRTRQAVLRVGGREAISHYESESLLQGSDSARPPVAAVVRCVLETGRTHQIRLHMAHIGCPVIGDGVYGAGFQTKANGLAAPLAAGLKDFRRQALHAFLLGFTHPVTGEAMRFESPLPADIKALLAAFEAAGYARFCLM